DIFFSMFFGVENRIVHSHSSVFSAKIINCYINKFLNIFLNIFSTNKLACSKKAGIAKFKNNKFQVVFNGIDINEYKYSLSDRRLYREKFGLDESDIILGHVGAFNSIKNQDFIVDIFDELLKMKKNYILFFVGDGDLKEIVISKVKELKLEKKIFFLGQRDDVNSLLSMFDIFLFPSKFEGLGISVVEAQAVGLKSIVSENVPVETKVTDIISYIPLERQIWVNKIINTNLVIERDKYNNIVENSQFNIKYAAKDLLDIYKLIN
ncbi:glycosyltransferase, partial [Acinetobacter baumannii]|nr:glycosyltransferase [Acinetobacter baumannii]